MLFNSDGKITKYDNENSIFEEYFCTRLHYYGLRKTALIRQLEKICMRLNNKFRFIDEVISGTVKILGLKIAQITE